MEMNSSQEVAITEDTDAVPTSRSQAIGMGQLIAASTLSGILIVAYVMLLSFFDERKTKEDPVVGAARQAAGMLAALSETHSGLGKIGLCDSKDSNTTSGRPIRATSLNSARASLLLCAFFVNYTGKKEPARLLDYDLELLDSVERKLLARLRQSIEKGGTDSDGTVYEAVRKRLREKLPGSVKVEAITISLGKDGRGGGITNVRAPLRQQSEAHVKGGFYLENLPIPVTEQHDVRFYRQAEKIESFEPASFVSITPDTPPSAIMVEAVLQDEKKGRQIKRACATIGSPVLESDPNCLILRFPHGFPSSFANLKDFLSKQTYVERGHWEQAEGGPVPGQGRLSPAIDPVLPSMSPDEALAVAMYHWLRRIQPPPLPGQIESLVDASLVVPHPSSGFTRMAVNSCLMKDTGARERTFIQRSGRGNELTKALMRCLEYPMASPIFPPSAFPILVDDQGRARISGTTRFDGSLISDYLNDLFATNLAAIDTMSTAQAFLKESTGERAFLKSVVLKKTQKLAALKKKRSYLARLAPSSNDNDREAIQIAINQLEESIAGDRARMALLGDARTVAHRVDRNAHSTARKTYEICSRNFALCAKGLHRVTSPFRAYLLGRSQVFRPITVPISEAEIMEAARASRASRKQSSSPWIVSETGADTDILIPWRQAFGNPAGARIDNKPLDMIMAEKQTAHVIPTTMIFDSRDLVSIGEVRPHIGFSNPYQALPVPPHQSIFFSKAAIKTGKNPSVMWSLIIRDSAFHWKATEAGRTAAQLPVDASWCGSFNPPLSSPPALACELNLRQPVPLLGSMKTRLPTDTMVTDPIYDRRLPLIPPIPAQMM